MFRSPHCTRPPADTSGPPKEVRMKSKSAHQASPKPRPATESVSGKRQGRTCFGGTRVTVDLLFTHLASGGTVDSFLAEYDHVGREQVVVTLKRAGCIMVARGHERKRYLRERRHRVAAAKLRSSSASETTRGRGGSLRCCSR